MSYAALVVGVVGTGYKIYDSAHKASQAKRLAASNQRPVFAPDGSIKDVYNLATSEINDNQLQDFATRGFDQSLSGSIDAVLKSGGKADFGTIENQYGSQFQAALESIKKNRAMNIAAFNNAAYNKAQSGDAAFMYNKDAPYKDAKQQEAELRQQAEQSKMDAIGGAATSVANYGIATTQAGEYAREAQNTARAFMPRSQTNPDLITSGAVRSNAGMQIPAVAPNVTPGAVNTNFQYPVATSPFSMGNQPYQDIYGDWVQP